MKYKASEYMNLNRLEFIVTYQCSGKCIHCSVGEQLNYSKGGKSVLPEKATKAIEALADIFDITSVMTFGGEPLLYPEVVCAIHQKALECGIASRQLITNGYFTRSKAKRTEVANRLSLAGINDLLLSVDAFHQEKIPIEAVHQFACDIVEAGLKGISLQPAWVINEETDNIYNTKTHEILLQFSDLGLPISTGDNIFMAGNAVKYLAQYYPPPHLSLADKCGSMPYTEPLTEVSSLSIVPNGDVMICGFVIGNIYAEDITEIVHRYDPYQNEYMRAIIQSGAAGLLSCAKKAGMVIDTSTCYSVCDICRQVTCGALRI